VGVNPRPRTRAPALVDLEYTVEEKPSDRLELSGGYGGWSRGGVPGLSFTNFSMRKLFDSKCLDPAAGGRWPDLNLRAQTNGQFYQSYSISFIEPWLGGRKPNSLSLSGLPLRADQRIRPVIDSDDGTHPTRNQSI
jgi:outer membrane protein insertion porin family